jgi:DNA repair and recombination protein RAD54B
MYRRPFVAPLLKRPLPPADNQRESSEKRLRLDVGPSSRPELVPEADRTPLLNLHVPNYSAHGREFADDAYFSVLWRNLSTKKHKTWEGDGILCLEQGLVKLIDMQGKPYVFNYLF